MAAILKILQLGRDNKMAELREYLANQVRPRCHVSVKAVIPFLKGQSHKIDRALVHMT